jgi:hypothetical protein
MFSCSASFQGPNNSSLVEAATAVVPTQLSSNAAVLLSASQQHGVNSPNIVDRLSQQIAMNMDQIQRLMNNTNANATVASPPDRQEIMLPQMAGIGSICHNKNDYGIPQQRQLLFSPRVSQYARYNNVSKMPWPLQPLRRVSEGNRNNVRQTWRLLWRHKAIISNSIV